MAARPAASKSLASLRRGRAIDAMARRFVQIGFLGLFLYPLFAVVYKRITFQTVPTFTSWLLPWDPLLLAGQLVKRDWDLLVLGAPLLLIALSLVLGRFFCGWVCPIGTVLDLVRPLAFWQKEQTSSLSRGFHRGKNSNARYFILAGVMVAGLFSIQALGWLDPLVIFHRAANAMAIDFFALQQPAVHAMLSLVSLAFVAIVALELWQPRFWCRNLCPLGALLSLVSRFSLLNRKVTNACTLCGDCRRTCPMNAIPKEPHETSYADCTFCLECDESCPNQGITFGFGGLAGTRWQRGARQTNAQGAVVFDGKYVIAAPAASLAARKPAAQLTRREAISGAAVGLAGFAVAPLAGLAPQTKVIRPPGAMQEDEFLRTCIACQECVRVCPTHGLRPVFLEAGLSGIGTPRLVPRQGGCSLNPSCPDLCAKVCPVGALQPIEPKDLKLGLAVVTPTLCLAWDQGVKCLVCVEACLVHAAVAYQGRVTVDPQKCTGCGRCESGCPVPGSAIRVQPFS